jgi:hypothetical protein
MMQLKYMSSCARPLFLLLVSNFFILLILLSHQVSAEWINSEGIEYIDKKSSDYEACKNALMKAKRNALSKARLEFIQSQQIQICSENKKSSNCKLFESTFDYIDGGFITEIKNQDNETDKETIVNSSPLRKCVVKISANVIKYNEKADPNFLLSAKLINKPIVYEGDKIIINGQVNQKSFISVYGFYPDIDAEKYHQIFPNKFDKKQDFEKNIHIPRKSHTSIYDITAKFPEKIKKTETQEILIVIATKNKLDIIKEQKIVDFDKRLYNLGRSNWKKIILGYTILKD